MIGYVYSKELKMVNWIHKRMGCMEFFEGHVDGHHVFSITPLDNEKVRLADVTYTIPEFGDFGEFDTLESAQESAGLMIGVAKASREDVGWLQNYGPMDE